MNISNTSTGGAEMDEDPYGNMRYQTVYTASLVLLSVAVTIANILVLLTFYKDKSLRSSTGIIIMSLACCDLITGSVAVPSVVMTTIDHTAFHFMRTGIACDFSAVTAFGCFNCSLLVLAMISIQRFFLITRTQSPLASNKSFCVGAIAIIYIYSFGLAMVPLVPNFNGFVLYRWSTFCTADVSRGEMDGYRTMIFTVFYNSFTFLIAGASIALAQVRILREIFQRTRANLGGVRGQQLREYRRLHATKMIFCMVVGFLLCTIPIMILLFVVVAGVTPAKEYAAFASYLTWFNSLLNPAIYWFCNRSYRSSFKTTMHNLVSVDRYSAQTTNLN